MTTSQLILLDHAFALLSAAAWLGAGAAAAARRSAIALAVLAAAVLITAGRVASVAVLAGRGWWFVQEKVVFGLPLLLATGAVAVLVAGYPLSGALRRPDPDTLPTGAVVSLFSAGYAALAGFAVTFVAGYPLTWSVALITVSLVAASALSTWRVVAAPADEHRVDRGVVLSRRRFIGVAGGTVVAGAGAAGVGLVFVPADSVDAGGGPVDVHLPEHSVPVTRLRGPATPAPGGRQRRYTLTARTETVTLSSGRQVEAWTYDGQVPGPPLTAQHGDLVEVTLRNDDIDDGVTLHWHGYDVACGEDGAPGVTQDVVLPGGEFVYRFRAEQVGTYWYHTHQVSAVGVRLGLYGALVVTPRAEAAPGRRTGQASAGLDLTLPVHTLDGTSVIGEHDTVVDHVAAAGTPVRLRLINTDSAPRRFALAGTPFRLVARDGRDLNEPGELSRVGLRLPAGGRYDLAFVMPDAPVALVVDGHEGGVLLRPDGSTAHEDDATPGKDADGWPELDLLSYGEPAPVPFDADSRADRNFTLVLDRGVAMVDGSPAYAHTVDGRGHPSIPRQLVAEGELVRFTVVNRSMETHPWHLHGHSVLILARDGQAPSGSPLWADTFDVRPGEVWEVAFRAGNPGLWMNHCHNLPHAQQGMMLQLGYDGVTSPFHGAHAAHGVDGGGSGPAGGPDHEH